MKPTLSDQRLDIELYRRPQRRNAKCHHKRDHAVDPPGRAFLRKLSVSGGVAVDDGIARAHRQHGVIPVAQLLLQNDAFKVSQGRGHALEALPKADEFVFYNLLTEPSVEQPRLEMLLIPAIECELGNVVLGISGKLISTNLFLAHNDDLAVDVLSHEVLLPFRSFAQWRFKWLASISRP